MTDQHLFSPDEIRQAQHQLGLADRHMARMLGITTVYLRRLKVADPTAASARRINRATARLLQAYLDGYRPRDWPAGH